MKHQVLFVWFVVFSALSSSCTHKGPQFKGATEGEKLHQYFEWSFNKRLETSPMELSFYGIDKMQDQLDDLSKKSSNEKMTMLKDHLALLENFDRDKLSKEDQLNYDLYKSGLEKKIGDYKWEDYSYFVRPSFSTHTAPSGLLMNVHKVNDEKDLQNYISRLNAFKNFFSDLTNRLMLSETMGVVPPKFVHPYVISDCQNLISGAPFEEGKKDSPLMADFRAKLQKLKLTPEKEKDYLVQAEKALLTSVLPGFKNLMQFMTAQEKRATTDDGAWKFPKGRDFYEYSIARETTTTYGPEQIHQLGLRNVERIQNEMRALQKKMKVKGDLKAFFKYMQSDRFHYQNTDQGRRRYMSKATGLIAGMRKKLDQFFITKPKAAIEVRRVEPYREKSAGSAFYQSPSLDGQRPGVYYINLHNMKTQPMWEMEALAYHEGIPGHHMQLSISQEMKALPLFRRLGHVTAFVEGWGLYSERLPKEYGFYKEPMSDFGRLSMELTRACRLVVDTGIHWKKWSKEEATKFLDDNTPGDHEYHAQQIRRYVTWPGQATAYMVGMLKIVELREIAKKELGQKFDIRKFHDVVLRGGSMPLDLLESQVISFVAREKDLNKL